MDKGLVDDLAASQKEAKVALSKAWSKLKGEFGVRGGTALSLPRNCFEASEHLGKLGHWIKRPS